MIEAVRNVFSHYATFAGRASRSEYWWWVLFTFLILAVTNLIDFAIVTPLLGVEDGQPLSFLVSVALLLPTLAVGARRLHDTGRSGWWLLIGLIPVLGTLVLLYFLVQPSRSAPLQD